MRVIFMGTPEFAVPALQALLQADHQIVAVYTQPDRPAGRGQQLTASAVKLEAQRHGLRLLQRHRLRDAAALEEFQQIPSDLAVVAAYGLILPEAILKTPRLGCVNIHASILPKYRGAAPVQHALWRGEKITGVTIMQMDAGLDTGPVWRQQQTEIGLQETAGELLQRLSSMGAQLLIQTLPEIEAGRLRPQPQDDSQASLAPRLRKEEGRLSWQQPAGQLHNQIRAFNPWPGCFTFLRETRTLVWRSLPLSTTGNGEAAPGTVAQVCRQGIDVLCGDRSLLRLLEVQWPGRKIVAASDFANGIQLRAGEHFRAEVTGG